MNQNIDGSKVKFSKDGLSIVVQSQKQQDFFLPEYLLCQLKEAWSIDTRLYCSTTSKEVFEQYI